MEPVEDMFGYVLSEQFKNLDEEIIHFLERDDNYLHEFSSLFYFSDYADWNPKEQQLVNRASGKVLDVGCGAGRHALYLQSKDMDVVGVDISPKLVQLCQARGVKQVIEGSILSLRELDVSHNFDTVIIMGNNFPLCHSEELMLSVLDDIDAITTTGGKILMQLITATPTDNPIHLDYHKRNLDRGRRRGQVKFRLRYLNLVGDWMKFYLPTPEELDKIVGASTWKKTYQDMAGNRHFIELQKQV